MVRNAADIRDGMDVIGLDGKTIGRVDHVWLDIEGRDESELSNLAHSAARGLMPLEAVKGTVEVSGGYFHVHSDAAELYIPFDEVQVLFPGQNVTLSCSCSECEEQFARRPRVIGPDDGSTTSRLVD